MKFNRLYLSFYVTFSILTLACGSTCTTETLIPSGGRYTKTKTFFECDLDFEICCSEGCCSRFNHAHIWIFAAVLSFVTFLCIFGCWLWCCRKMSRSTGTTPTTRRNEDRVDSPLTIRIPETRNEGARVQTQNNPVPLTPPPTYEEATRMR